MRHFDQRKITALHQAVIAIINEEGFQNLSVAKIARRAGVSVATLYVYYKNKQAMLGAVYLEIKDLFDAHLVVPAYASGELEAMFKQSLHEYADLITSHPQEAAVMRVFNNNPDLIPQATYQLAMARAKPLQGLYEEGLATHQLRAVSPETVIAFSFNVLDTLQELRTQAGEPLNQEAVAAAIDMAWAACRQPD